MTIRLDRLWLMVALARFAAIDDDRYDWRLNGVRGVRGVEAS